ncbi:MAG: hypothetical protein AAGK17_13895 [Pseudomonadota bacterium]
MSWFLVPLAVMSFQETVPIKVVPAPPSAAPMPAILWSCNFSDTSGDTIVLNGQIPEVPAGWDHYDRLEVNVEGLAPEFLLGKQKFEIANSPNANTRRYSFSALGPDGMEYIANFQFVRDQLSLATISRYSPPTESDRGRITAFATGACSPSFKEIGEEVLSQ